MTAATPGTHAPKSILPSRFREWQRKEGRWHLVGALKSRAFGKIEGS